MTTGQCPVVTIKRTSRYYHKKYINNANVDIIDHSHGHNDESHYYGSAAQK